MEIFHDDEADNWGFSVPTLNIVGGGCETREEAIQHGERAIRFLLESGDEDVPAGTEIVRFRVELIPAN